MKKITTHFLRFALCLSLFSGTSLLAQDKADSVTESPGQMRLKITEKNGDDTRVIERTYRSDGMTDERRDAIVNQLIDSLRAARKGKSNGSNISVIIEDSYKGPARGSRRNRVLEDQYLNGDAVISGGGVIAPTPPPAPEAPDLDLDIRLRSDMDSARVRARARARDMRRKADEMRSRSYEFRMDRRQMDSLGRAMGRMGRDLNRQLAPMADRLGRDFRNYDWHYNFSRPFNSWADGGQTSTVRGLDVYPNNPDRHILNLRFNAPAKGDVQILVTNTKGKEIASRELKDFSGEFVGQIDLGKKGDGVVFVTVTQNDDGAVRRVVLRKADEKTTR